LFAEKGAKRGSPTRNPGILDRQWIDRKLQAEVEEAHASEKRTMASTKLKSDEKKRRVVFRQLLDSPFNLIWKSVDQKTSDDILDVLCSLLAPLAAHRPQKTAENIRKRKKTSSEHSLIVDPPSSVSSMTLGFNATTEHLESEIRKTSTRTMRAVFIARGDTSSTHLYAHFPLMSSMLPNVRLVSLAKGAETRLRETLKLRRVGVIGVLDGAPGADTLFELVEGKVPRIEHGLWTPDGTADFVPTRVKWVESVQDRKSDKQSLDSKKKRKIDSNCTI